MYVCLVYLQLFCAIIATLCTFVALCSKTYHCWGDKTKTSCKGLNKNLNPLNKQDFLKVLSTKESGGGTNKGFRVVKNMMFTYEQQRKSLSYLYIKHKVLDDGVSTEPILL